VQKGGTIVARKMQRAPNKGNQLNDLWAAQIHAGTYFIPLFLLAARTLCARHANLIMQVCL